MQRLSKQDFVFGVVLNFIIIHIITTFGVENK